MGEEDQSLDGGREGMGEGGGGGGSSQVTTEELSRQHAQFRMENAILSDYLTVFPHISIAVFFPFIPFFQRNVFVDMWIRMWTVC